MTAPRVLVVDDEAPIVDLVKGYLEREGMEVMAAADGPTGLEAIRDRAPDVVVLDVMLPGLDGFEVLRRARALTDAYVIMLTARAEEIDRIVGLSVGADDYLVKPFALREVEARLKALVARRRGRVVSRKLVHGGIEFDPANLAVSVDGRPVHLSRKCLRLLEMMMTAPNRVYSRAELEQALWGDEHPQSDSLRSHMHLLRRALTDGRGHSPIETVHGVGYRFAAADARQA